MCRVQYRYFPLISALGPHGICLQTFWKEFNLKPISRGIREILLASGNRGGADGMLDNSNISIQAASPA